MKESCVGWDSCRILALMFKCKKCITYCYDNAESKAIILHPGPRCVPSIFDHDNGTHAMLQYDPEGVSDEILLPGPDCVLSVSDHDDACNDTR